MLLTPQPATIWLTSLAFSTVATGAIGPFSSQPKMRTYLRISQASVIFVSMLAGPTGAQATPS